jgi:hypothetical protein
MMIEIDKAVGTDVDGVLAAFGQGFIERSREMGIDCCFPEDHTKITKWFFPCEKHFKEVWNTVETDESFWLGLKPLEPALSFFKSDKAFVPRMYVTKRHVPSEITRTWLLSNGFPDAEVITVDDAAKKTEIVKKYCDLYVDDLVSTIRDMRHNNVNAILYKAPYQISEDISGLPIIENFTDLYCMGELP